MEHPKHYEKDGRINAYLGNELKPKLRELAKSKNMTTTELLKFLIQKELERVKRNE